MIVSCLCFPGCARVLSPSVVSDSVPPQGLQSSRLLCPWGFSRQEYWSGLPCPPLGVLPNPGIEPRSPTLQGDSLPSEPPGKPCFPRKQQMRIWYGPWTFVSCILFYSKPFGNSSLNKKTMNLLMIYVWFGYKFKIFFFFNLNLLIYFWLHWIFVTVHGLSLAEASGATLLLQHAGFSLQWLLLIVDHWL